MKIRLYHPEPLAASEQELPPEESHYLCRVLRMKTGQELFLFNSREGEWRTRVLAAHPKKCRIKIEECLQEGRDTPELHLCFAPIKKSRLPTIFAMATELGVTHFQPVLTRYTHAALGNPARIERQLIEASEQCERLDVPILLPAIKWPAWIRMRQQANTPLLACTEPIASSTVIGKPMHEIMAKDFSKPITLLIGPEGGFSESERQDIAQLPQCFCVNLGSRILRSETAIATALAQYQALAVQKTIA